MPRARRNDFYAKPPKFSGAVARGVEKFPGFHTATDKDTTYAYAQMKVVPEYIEYEPDEMPLADIVVPDYPVVVSFDMKGMKSKTDFDAIETVRPVLVDVAKQVVDEDEEPIDALQDYVEFGEQQRDGMPTEALEWLFEYGSPVMLDSGPSLLAFAEEQDDPNAFLVALADGSLPDDALAEITGQFRYTDNVSSDRVVEIWYEIWYVQPWWPKILNVLEDDEEQEALVEQLEALNWSVVADDDVYSHTLGTKEASVYARKASKTARIEYHGTTYLNLLSAASELDLPVPPHPFHRA